MIEKVYVSRWIAQAFPRVTIAISISEAEISLINRTSNRIIREEHNPFIIFPSLIFRHLTLIDLWCVDYCKSLVHQCYELNYRFRSFIHLNCDLVYPIHLTSRNSLSTMSVSTLFPSAGWLEREILDLYGIFFTGNCDSRRISTDYGFTGYPFRRNFPLLGHTEMRYDDEHAELTVDLVQPAQNFRFGHKPSAVPWNLL